MALIVTPDGYLIDDGNGEPEIPGALGPTFATAAQLSAYTDGLIAEDDLRVPLLLAGATRAIQRYAGWHIAPAKDVQLILDGGSNVVYLPTLKLNGVNSLTVDGGALLDKVDYEWSRATGNIRSKRRSGFPETWGGIEVSFNSGFAGIPADLTQVVLQVVSQALSSPTGATREQAGAVSMQWATTAPGVSGGLSLLERDLAIIDQYRIAKEA